MFEEFGDHEEVPKDITPLTEEQMKEKIAKPELKMGEIFDKAENDPKMPLKKPDLKMGNILVEVDETGKPLKAVAK